MEKKVSNTVLISLPLLYFMLSCVLTSQKFRNIFSIELSLLCGVMAYFVFSLSTSGLSTRNDEFGLIFLSGIQIAMIGIGAFFIRDSLHLEETKAYLNGLLVLSISCLASFVLQGIDEKSLKILVRIYLFAIVFFSVLTLYVELTGPENVIRYTAMGIFHEASVIYGGYDFIYSIVIVYCVLFFYYILNRKKISFGSRFFIVTSLIIIFLTVALSNYSTALLLIVFFSFSPFLAKVKHKIIWAILLMLVFFVFSRAIAKLVENLPLSELTTRRISNLILSLTGHEGVENPISGEGERLDRMVWSLKIILENPLIGGFLGDTKLPFGYHTEWIEKAARHGLIYIGVHAAFWIKSYKKTVSYCETIEQKNLIKTAFIVFVFLGFLNPVTMVTTPAPLFLLCPFLSTAFPVLEEKLY